MPGGKTPRRLRRVLALLGAAAIFLVALTGYQALKARDALQDVAVDFSEVAASLTSGDLAEARDGLERAQVRASEARENTHGAGWWLTSKIPGVGRNVTAVRTVAHVADRLAQEVLPEVVVAAETLEPRALRPSHGRIDLEPIESVAPLVVHSDAALHRQAERVDAIDLTGLAPAIAEPIDQMQVKLGEAAALSDRAARAVQLLPAMLGAEERRDYLLLFQNNAEARATGGIPGAFAVVTARNGRVELGRQGDASTIGRLETPPIPLTADEVELYGENLGRYPQNITFTPDFPRTAELARAMWNKASGRHVDGVISVDPVALSYLLRGTGPVRAPGGRELTADNAVRLLLSDVYAEIPDPAVQNRFFNKVAGSVFDAVAAGRGDPQAVLEGLAQGVAERRLLIWSSDPREQRILGPLKVSGALARTGTSRPRVGVYLNDGTGAKMSYYLRHHVRVTTTGCQDERQLLKTSVKLRSTAPDDTRALPDYVAESVAGAPRGVIRTTFYLYAPVRGYIREVSVDGTTVDVSRLQHEGRQVIRTTLDLRPGEHRRLDVAMVGGPGQLAEPLVRTTPGAFDPGVGEVDWEECA
jgi:hypothetical protein